MDIAINIENSERDFIAACIAKERWAQRKLYEDNYSILLPLCLRYSNQREDALDILHEGFIKIFKHISKYQPGTSLTAWMKRIMVNTAIDYYRKRTRRRTENLDTVYNVKAKGEDAVSKISAQEIMVALKQLTPGYRTVFNLYVVEGYSHREISDMLKITESTSRSNLVKARGKLKTILLAREMNYGR